MNWRTNVEMVLGLWGSAVELKLKHEK